MDNTFNTLEEIQATFGTSLFGDSASEAAVRLLVINGR